MALNNTPQRIERSIYKAIHTILVREGYWVNDQNYTNDATGATNLKNALIGVTNTKGYYIEPFGPGSSKSKGEKYAPRIAMVGKRLLPGNIGNPSSPQPEPHPTIPGHFKWVIPPDMSMMLQIDIHLVARTAEQSWVLDAVLAEALGARRHLKFYDDATRKFFIKQYNYYDIPDATEGLTEKIYSYEVNDIYLTDGEVIEQDVPGINHITIELYTSTPKKDGSVKDQKDSDFIIQSQL